jgi:hypothetical protein
MLDKPAQAGTPDGGSVEKLASGESVQRLERAKSFFRCTNASRFSLRMRWVSGTCALRI